jgi:tetratricopeptide (TPR) repeat protein
MGVVYSAYDPKLDRRVALKLLRGDRPLSVGSSARLAREAQTMARLSHPNVVAVYDVGTVEDQVFVAMQHIKGKTLSAWLRERRRGWSEILAAFRMAGAGLAAAHAAGIIHRDFNPDNVLIGDDGHVRVTDFGLAHILSNNTPEGTLTEPTPTATPDQLLTTHGHNRGTPAYMAPEQADAAPIDARSDIFSFCVALYEALYGERPFAGGTLGELRDAVRTGVRDPSRGSNVPLWVRRIIMRGLAHEPAKRFPSMDALLSALRRDPAAARRRLMLGGAILAAVAGAAALAVFAMEARARTCSGAERKLAGAWDEARRNAGHAAFLSAGRAFAPDSWRAVEEALDGYARRWIAMHTEACEATRVRGEQSEELLDLRVYCLTLRRGELAGLTAVFAKADGRVVEKAVEAVHRLTPLDGCADIAALRSGAAPPVDEEARAHAAQARSHLDSSKALVNAGKPRQALAAASAALPLANRSGVGAVIAEARYRLGIAQAEVGDYRGAVQSLSMAHRQGVASRSDEIAARSAIELPWWVGWGLERIPEAERWAQDASAFLDRIGRPPRLEALYWYSHGKLQSLKGRDEQAILDYRRALVLLDGAGQPVDLRRATYLQDLALSLINFAQYEEATTRLREALAIVETRVGKTHPFGAQILSVLVRALRMTGRSFEALDAARRALAIREQAFGPTYMETLQAVGSVAVTLGDLARFDEAIPMLRRAITMAERLVGPEHREVHQLRYILGLLSANMGRHEEALTLLQNVLAARERKLPRDHPLLVWTRIGLAIALSATGHHAEALATVEQARAIQRRQRAPNEHFDVMLSMLRGGAEVGLGKYREALRSYEGARTVSEHLYGSGHFRVGQALLGCGEAMVGLGRFADATRVLGRALSLLIRAEGRQWLVARARFSMARAVWGATRDRRRALALASQARADWVRFVPADRRTLRRMDDWLERVRR